MNRTRAYPYRRIFIQERSLAVASAEIVQQQGCREARVAIFDGRGHDITLRWTVGDKGAAEVRHVAALLTELADAMDDPGPIDVTP